MGMTTHVVGFRPADDRWNQMKKAWEACTAAGIPLPREVYEFFDGEEPDDKPGMDVDIEDAIAPFNAEGRRGFDVHIDKLPPGVKTVRFYNAW